MIADTGFSTLGLVLGKIKSKDEDPVATCIMTEPLTADLSRLEGYL